MSTGRLSLKVMISSKYIRSFLSIAVTTDLLQRVEYESRIESVLASFPFREGGTGNYEQIMKDSANISQETTLIIPTAEELDEYKRADSESNSGTGEADTFSDADQESLEQAEEDKANSEQNAAKTED